MRTPFTTNADRVALVGGMAGEQVESRKTGYARANASFSNNSRRKLRNRP
jgi:hypothetical protein